MRSDEGRLHSMNVSLIILLWRFSFQNFHNIWVHFENISLFSRMFPITFDLKSAIFFSDRQVQIDNLEFFVKLEDFKGFRVFCAIIKTNWSLFGLFGQFCLSIKQPVNAPSPIKGSNTSITFCTERWYTVLEWWILCAFLAIWIYREIIWHLYDHQYHSIYSSRELFVISHSVNTSLSCFCVKLNSIRLLSLYAFLVWCCFLPPIWSPITSTIHGSVKLASKPIIFKSDWTHSEIKFFLHQKI